MPALPRPTGFAPRLVPVLALLLLAGCATSRPARQARQAPVVAEPTVEAAPAPGRPSMLESITPWRRSPSSDLAEVETYTGPVALAILPVAEGRPSPVPEVSRWWIQKLLAEEIGRTGQFAGVIPLADAASAHEAGLVLEPVLTALSWSGPGQRDGRIGLRVRLRQAESGGVRLDRVYQGACRNCAVPAGQPPVAGPLAGILPDLRRDLERGAAAR